MSELNKQTEQPDLASDSASGIARRQMILASMGKGSAVVAAVAVPMNSLAAFGTLSVTADGKLCTFSGTMSMPHSIKTVTATCSGWSPSYYSDITKWPNYSQTNSNGQNSVPGFGNFNQNTPFRNLFGGGSNDQLIDILKNSPSSNEAIWVTAVLNGTAGSRAEATNFPYTAAQVVGFYTTNPVNALKFFKDYMQTNVA